MCEKLLFTLFFFFHMPWCIVHVPRIVHQALVLKKKKNPNVGLKMRIQAHTMLIKVERSFYIFSMLTNGS